MESEANGTPSSSTSNVAVIPRDPAPHDEELDVRSARYSVLNRRRAELIRKRYGAGLSPDEAEEYERLQKVCGDAVAKAFPAPTHLDETLRQLEALAAKQAATAE